MAGLLTQHTLVLLISPQEDLLGLTADDMQMLLTGLGGTVLGARSHGILQSQEQAFGGHPWRLERACRLTRPIYYRTGLLQQNLPGLLASEEG